jgi:uncharacterized damage-inducible protein DinB
MLTSTRLLAIAVIAACAAMVARGETLKVTPVPAGVTGFRAEYLHEMSGEEAKFLSLAESIPADKYTWRPGPGVRSVSEVLLHIAAANFNLPKLIGTPPPEGFSVKGYDTSTTDKAQVLEALRKSFAHLRAATVKLSDADGNKTLKLFGEDTTYRGVHFFILKHLAEHLGQLIAYARMNGVAPAWSAK